MSARFSAKYALRFIGAASVLALSACATNDAAEVGSSRLPMTADASATGVDPLADAAFWGTRYDRDPADKDAALAFSRALRRIGSLEESITVLQRTHSLNPTDPDVQLELGKALTAGARAFQGVDYIKMALDQRPDDWASLSAYGAALDQIGRHKEARAHYDAALMKSPDNASVLNNKALSFALDGQLDKAELLLRQAAGRPGSGAQIRQNLALVLGLKGDLAEAERLARADLPPRAADNNIAYFQGLLSQPAYWRDLETLDSPAPAAPQDETAPASEDVSSAAPRLLLPEAVSAAPLAPTIKD
ncbi:MAG: hypothetical protein AAGL49_01325 [Pseudomonadota bacterium]